MGIDTVTGHSDDKGLKCSRCGAEQVDMGIDFVCVSSACAPRSIFAKALRRRDDEAGRSDDVTDFVEKTQRAMHAEVERANALAEENVRLRAELEAEKRANAEMHDASEARHTRLRIANAHLSRLAAIVRTNCEEGKLHGFAAGTGTGMALRLALEHSTGDFVPRAEFEVVQTHCNDVTAELHRQLDAMRSGLREKLTRVADAVHDLVADQLGHGEDCYCAGRPVSQKQLDAIVDAELKKVTP